MPNPRPPDDHIKTCSRCGVSQPATAYHSHPGSSDGLQGRCKPCQNDLSREYSAKHPDRRATQHRDWVSRQPPGAMAKRQRDFHRKNPGKSSEYALKQHYGLPPGSYQKMLLEQDGKCAICGSAEPKGRGRFHVDHCHASHRVRGLLCNNCNLLIGHAEDSPDLLRAAIKYLDKYSPSIK